MSQLAEKKCQPCSGDTPPLKGGDLQSLLKQLDGWDVEREHHLSKLYTFPNFVAALAFVNKVGALAEEQGHHPDLYLTWGKVGVQIWTHTIDGLSESDFILAAKIDALPSA